MKPTFVTLLAAMAFAAPALAQKGSENVVAVAATAPGKGAVGTVVTVSASVEAIDKDNRTLTLKGPHGNVFRLVAGPEVRNFAQIKVGDHVVVRHAEALSLELKKGGAGIRERVESDTAVRTAAGQRPGVAEVRQLSIVADVLAVNARTNTVMLRGPEQTVDLHVRDPKQLKMIKVGDQVQATYTDAVAIAVEPAPGKK